MDAINLQGLWPNFAGSEVVPPTPPATRRGAWNPAWRKVLIDWLKRQAEEEEEERERLAAELERLVGPVRARRLMEQEARREAARVAAEDAEMCLVGSLAGDFDE